MLSCLNSYHNTEIVRFNSELSMANSRKQKTGNDSWPIRELIFGYEVTLSLYESSINMQIYGKSLMKILSEFRIEIQLSGSTKHSAIGDNLLGLFLKGKWVIIRV